jgi:hypothetical protein
MLQPTAMNLVPMFGMLALLVGVSYLLLFMLRLPARIWSSRKWPRVAGTVQKGIAERRERRYGPPSYHLVFEYTYTVEGVPRAGLFTVEAESESEGKKLLSKIEGQSAAVSYNPSRPEISFLAEKEMAGMRVSHGSQYVDFARDLGETSVDLMDAAKSGESRGRK